MMAENSCLNLNFSSSWIDEISVLKPCTSILPTFKREHLESVLGAPEEDEEEIQEATLSVAGAKA